jgi:inorganic pyrophosphatase
LVAVPVQSFDYADIRRLEDLNKDLKEQMIEFLELYNKNAGKEDKVTATGTPRRAVELVKEASRRFQDSRS